VSTAYGIDFRRSTNEDLVQEVQHKQWKVSKVSRIKVYGIAGDKVSKNTAVSPQRWSPVEKSNVRVLPYTKEGDVAQGRRIRRVHSSCLTVSMVVVDEISFKEASNHGWVAEDHKHLFLKMKILAKKLGVDETRRYLGENEKPKSWAKKLSKQSLENQFPLLDFWDMFKKEKSYAMYADLCN